MEALLALCPTVSLSPPRSRVAFALQVVVGQVTQGNINDDPPPTLTEVAKRLGQGTPVLYKCHPTAC